jgi:hypothetical protein
LKMRLSCITRMDDSNNCHEMHRLSWLWCPIPEWWSWITR